MFFIEVVVASVNLMLAHIGPLQLKLWSISWDCHSLGNLFVCVHILGLVFGWETKGIWTRVLHRSYSYIDKLDVRILNHPNRTLQLKLWSISQDCHNLGYLSI